MTAPAPQLRAPTGLAMLLGAAVALLVGSGVSYYFLEARPAASAHAVPVDALYNLALDAGSALAGDAAALTGFEQRQKQLEEAAARDPAAPFTSDVRFTRLMSNAAAIVRARGALAGAGGAARETATLVPRLLGESSALAGGLPAGTATAVSGTLERFAARAQRLQLDVTALTQGTGDAGQAAQRIAEGSDYLGQVITGLMGGNSALALPRVTAPEPARHLKALDGIYTDLSAAVRRAVAAAPALPAARTASRAIEMDARELAGTASPAAVGGVLAWAPLVLLAAGLGILLAGLGATLRMRRTVERQRLSAEAQRRESDRNQQAILRLLDELSSLADGDLTVQATVTEDITGAIADSINYAVDALRGLVSAINGSAIQLDSATRQTQALSQHLSRASGAQSKQIASATESAASMAGTVEEVSGNAERASDVARHSVEVAHKGGDAVRRTIDGMNTIRETIQDTSKRIKRLGESSQEIGNIVELINDIAEQTNILALNASIQSSMAGEAGRGFAVVADEVQRLAERAANATKQIEVLVRTIQTDTNEAVVSMERSTTDVVGGALLAENAGAALEEIEQVSNQIASLVQNISGSARQQAHAAQNIARNMQVLKEISGQTFESTTATSTAIAKVAELSAGLRKSAAGFRLPGNAGDRASATGTVRRLEDTTLTTAKVRQISALGGS